MTDAGTDAVSREVGGRAEGENAPGFNGLIQHSFALRLDEQRVPFVGDNTSERVRQRFELPASGGSKFSVRAVGELADQGRKGELARHSALVRHGLTHVEPQGIAFLERRADGTLPALPKAFRWASDSGEEEPWPKFVFARRDDADAISLNDFIVEENACDHLDDQARAVSATLSQLLAHRRSLLFGIALAGRFVNVMLPHALLTPEDPQTVAGCSCATGCSLGQWLLQPLVSLRRVDRDQDVFRRMYSLSFFLIPVKGAKYQERKMARCEIRTLVNAGWGLASSPPVAALGSFRVSGPLSSYVARLNSPSVVPRLMARDGDAPAKTDDPPLRCRAVTLRQASETIMFAVALRMARGSVGETPTSVERSIGDDVVTSLGNSRVSSVVVVDGEFKEEMLDDRSRAFPGSLHMLMSDISEETRIDSSRKYRLDRPFFDKKDCAIGVLPASSCLLATVDSKAQKGRFESGLTHAGWIAYMAIGAATATGTIRSIHRDLEQLTGWEPKQIADVESQVVVDLSEIYDLDITWDAYRYRYRRLRKLLGVTSDYDALHAKLQALYRESETRFEDKTQKRLENLTKAIVAASIALVLVAVMQLIVAIAA